MKSWYKIKNKSESVGQIAIHDEIGLWGISAAAFIAELRTLNVKTIELSIHSPGGSVLDGLAMYNALTAHPAKIYGSVAGIAASAASFVLMAADVISMPADSFIMIHNAQGGAFGESSDLRHMADIMDKLQSSISNIYQKRTGIDAATIADMMAVETWLTADEAQALGFADQVTGKIGVAAKASDFNQYFKALPFNNTQNLGGIKTEREFEKFLRDSGVSNSQATALVATAKTLFRGEPENAERQKLTELANKLSQFSIPTSLNHE